MAKRRIVGYLCGMEQKHRLFVTVLVGALVGAALGRAAFGADTEASVLWSPAFHWGAPVAGLLVWPLSGQFGRAGLPGWLRAGAVVLAAALGAGVVAGLVLGAGPFGLLAALPGQPMGWGALVFAAGAAQVWALRRTGAGQSRK